MKLLEVLELSFRVWKHTENPVLLIFDDGAFEWKVWKTKKKAIEGGFWISQSALFDQYRRGETDYNRAPRHRGGHPTLQNQNRIQTHGAEAGPIEARPPSERAPAVRSSAGEGGALVQHSTFWSAPY